jgi:phytoene synthase
MSSEPSIFDPAFGDGVDRVLVGAGDRAACRDAIRGGSRTFHAASLLLPERVREPALALYAFCRFADDAIDHSDEPRHALDDLHERLEQASTGEPRSHPADRALAATLEACAIPRAIPAALLEGFAWDSSRRRYATLADVEEYAMRVAGTVGLMMALVMGVRSPRALARAADLGVAMQLSNIARDVGEDARAGRLYLPLEWLDDAGVDAAELLREPRFTPALGSVVARLVDHAGALYQRSALGVASLPVDCRPAIHAARLMYAEIGMEVARRGFDSISSRAVVSTRRKLALVARALTAAALPAAKQDPGALPAAEPLIVEVERHDAQSPPPATGAARGFGDQLVGILELFERLERRDRVGDGAT